jgi:hypothetical protein
MLTSILTLSVASLLSVLGGSELAVSASNVSVSLNAIAEKQQTTTLRPEAEFFHRGSGRCELPNCA